jgi:hypothetical protein
MGLKRDLSQPTRLCHRHAMHPKEIGPPHPPFAPANASDREANLGRVARYALIPASDGIGS